MFGTRMRGVTILLWTFSLALWEKARIWSISHLRCSNCACARIAYCYKVCWSWSCSSRNRGCSACQLWTSEFSTRRVRCHGHWNKKAQQLPAEEDSRAVVIVEKKEEKSQEAWWKEGTHTLVASYDYVMQCTACCRTRTTDMTIFFILTSDFIFIRPM